jgi:hypothetical protein
MRLNGCHSLSKGRSLNLVWFNAQSPKNFVKCGVSTSEYPSLHYSSDGVTLLQSMIDHGIDLHHPQACRIHAISVSMIFRPDPADGNLNSPGVHQLAADTPHLPMRLAAISPT